MTGESFRCGHPRTAENSAATGMKRRADGSRYTQCALCKRAKDIVAKVQADQVRINAGFPLGVRAASAWL